MILNSNQRRDARTQELLPLKSKVGFSEGQEGASVAAARHWLDEDLQAEGVAPGGPGVRGQHWPGGHHAR